MLDLLAPRRIRFASLPLVLAALFEGGPARAEDAPQSGAQDSSLGESPSINGGVGLLHMQHAQSGAPGQLRISFMSEYFSAGFLCTPTFPCPHPLPGGSV